MDFSKLSYILLLLDESICIPISSLKALFFVAVLLYVPPENIMPDHSLSWTVLL